MTRRRAKWTLAVVAAAISAVVAWAVVSTSMHSELRSEAGDQCHADVSDRYAGTATVLSSYVGEPSSGRFEYELVDTDSRFVWTCLASKNDGDWQLSVFKND